MLEFKRVGFELPESVTFENETFFYPEKIKFYKFDGYKINVIDKKSNDDKVVYKLALGSEIKAFEVISEIPEELLRHLIKVYPFDFNINTLTMNYLDNDYTVNKIVEHIQECAIKGDKATVFFHKDTIHVLKELGIEEWQKLVKNFIAKELRGYKTWSPTKSSLVDKVVNVINELDTITDTRFQLYINDDYNKEIVSGLILDYLLKKEFDLKGVQDCRNILFALSRDMVYDRKLDGVMSILNYNLANLGIFGLLSLAVIEQDTIQNRNRRRFIDRLDYYSASSIRGQRGNLFRPRNFSMQLEKILNKPTKIQTFSENFKGLSEEAVTQATGLYLSGPVSPIEGLEPLQDGLVDGLDVTIKVNNDDLRTLNYRKIANRIDQLLEESEFIKDMDTREKRLNDAKYIMEDIIDIQGMDEDNYPEMNVLMNRLHEIIADIQNKDFNTLVEDSLVVGAPDNYIAKSEALGKAIVKMPTAVIDAFSSIKKFKANPVPREKKRRGLWFKEMLYNIELAIDKIVPKGFAVGPVIIDMQKDMNNLSAKKSAAISNFKKAYNQKREDRGYRESAEDFINGYTNYKGMVISAEDFSDVVHGVADAGKGIARTGAKAVTGTAKGTIVAGKATVSGARKAVKAVKNSWRIVAIKKAFKEATVAIKYLLEHVQPEDYDIRRVAFEHLEYWQKVMNALEHEPGNERIVQSINDQITKFKKNLKELDLSDSGKN